jgi:hypothetical protein
MLATARQLDDIIGHLENLPPQKRPISSCLAPCEKSVQVSMELQSASVYRETVPPAPLTAEEYELCSSPGSSVSKFNQSKTHGRHGRRASRIAGTASNDYTLMASSTMSELFVYNLHTMTEVPDLLRYATARTKVLKLSKISHPDSRSASFLLVVPLSDERWVRDAEFWPDGVQCRRFIRPSTGRLACCD